MPLRLLDAERIGGIAVPLLERLDINRHPDKCADFIINLGKRPLDTLICKTELFFYNNVNTDKKEVSDSSLKQGASMEENLHRREDL